MSRPYSELKENIKGYKNYFFYTNTIGRNKALIDGGINPIGDNLPDGRIPAILININPLKSGSEDTPWMDIIDNEVKQPLLAGLAIGLLIQLYGIPISHESTPVFDLGTSTSRLATQ